MRHIETLLERCAEIVSGIERERGVRGCQSGRGITNVHEGICKRLYISTLQAVQCPSSLDLTGGACCGCLGSLGFPGWRGHSGMGCAG
jgi:hypothetical protein